MLLKRGKIFTYAMAAGAALAMIVTVPHMAQAGTLDLTQPVPGPDIDTTAVLSASYTYNSVSNIGQLSASNSGDYYSFVTFDNNTIPFQGIFDLEASFNGSGALQPGGTITITNLDAGSTILVQGTLTNFGFPTGSPAAPNPLFDFTFNVTTDNTPSAQFGNTGGIILEVVNSSTPFSFAANYSGDTGASFANAFAVKQTPLPSASYMGLFLLGGLAAIKLRKSRRAVNAIA